MAAAPPHIPLPHQVAPLAYGARISYEFLPIHQGNILQVDWLD